MDNDDYMGEEAQNLGLELLRVYELIVTVLGLLPLPIMVPSLAEHEAGDLRIEDMVAATQRAWTIVPEQVLAPEIVRAALQTAITHWLVSMDLLARFTHTGDRWAVAGVLLNLGAAERALDVAGQILTDLADE
ncbi:hypothetical protein [Embleya sp. NPDC059237]|uniref:hypothetical protein n=1 Tax=Embleya sp. NPDC059237 TaxID=3346784 RepID=UPI00367EB359